MHNSRKKNEDLSEDDQLQLKDAVFQLVSYHRHNEAEVSEITNLLSHTAKKSGTPCKQDLIKSCLVSGMYSETESFNILESCVSQILDVAVCNDGATLSEGQKEHVSDLVRMMCSLIEEQTSNRPRLLNLLCNELCLPVYLLWNLHKEELMSLDTYLLFKQTASGFLDTISKMFVKEIKNSQETVAISGIFSQLLKNAYVERKEGGDRLRKISKTVLDKVTKDILDSMIINKEKIEIPELSCPVDVLKNHSLHVISMCMGHRPVLKVADALKEQKNWTFSKLPTSLVTWYKQLITPLELTEVLEHVKAILEKQEVNWQAVLSFISTSLVCMPGFSRLVQDYISDTLRTGLESTNLENLVISFLFARQGCYEGPLVFMTYQDWFERMFADQTHSPASSRKTFGCLMKFLTDMVPFESAAHLKTHILRPPFVPPRCRELLTDYILLAKTRLADLKQSLDQDGAVPEISDLKNKQKLSEQIEEEIQKALVAFENSRKVPSSIMETSIFRKPYFVGKFLPVLLKARALPDIPDLRMKFIESLRRVEKIPSTLYNSYIAACKAESSRLMEGVFLEEDMDLDIMEQLQLSLDQLLSYIKEGIAAKVTEQCAHVRERLLTALEEKESDKVYQDTFVLDMRNTCITSVQLKVVDQTLEFLSQACHLLNQEGSLKTPWPHEFMTLLMEIKSLHKPLLTRIWKLCMEQASALEIHHIRVLAFLLSQSHLLNTKFSELQIKCCDYTCHQWKGLYSEIVWQQLHVETKSCREFAYSLLLEYTKIISILYSNEDLILLSEELFPQSFCKKFQFLSSRFAFVLMYQPGLSTFSSVPVEIQSVILKKKFSLKDWLNLEIRTSTDSDDLSYENRRMYIYDCIYNRYLSQDLLCDKGIQDYRTLCSHLLQELLDFEMSMETIVHRQCPKCENRRNYCQSKLLFINILQETCSFIAIQGSSAKKTWLIEELKKGISTQESKVHKQAYIHGFSGVMLCLPSYLFFCDSPDQHPDVLPSVQVINDELKEFMCRSCYLPVHITTYLLQGLTQTITEGCDNLIMACPLLFVSALVHLKFTESLLQNLCTKCNSSKLLKIMQAVEWINGCIMKNTESVPEFSNCDIVIWAGTLLSITTSRASVLKSILSTIVKEKENPERRQVLDLYFCFLVAELSNQEKDANIDIECVVETLLTLDPTILQHFTSQDDVFVLLVPETLYRLSIFHLLKFLQRRHNVAWQSHLSFPCNILRIYKTAMKNFGQLVCTSTKTQTGGYEDLVDLADYVKLVFRNSSYSQLADIHQDALIGCDFDIVLSYRAAIQQKR